MITIGNPSSAINGNMPTVLPTLDLDFANSQTIDSRVSFSRSGPATRVNKNGLIENVAADVPRIDYDPITGVCKGLLIEEARTNLLTYSEQFDNAAWGKGNVTATANALTAPDGTLTADKLVETTAASSYHYSPQSVTKAAAAITYTCTLFVKNGGRRLELSIGDAGGGCAMTFDPSTGSIASGAGVYGTFTNPSGSAVNVGNGWHLVSMTATTGAYATVAVQIALNNGSTNVYTGDGTSGIYIWGAQLEAGAFATSYIPSQESWTSRGATTAASYYNSTGLLAYTTGARMNYNPTNTDIPPKLLFEAASTNLLGYSEQFENAAWAKTFITTTANTCVAPDGLTTADTLLKTAAGAYTNAAYTFAATTTYTFSVFARYKSVGGLFSMVFQPSYANRAGATFDLINGTVVGSAAAGGGTSIINNVSIQDVGHGWFRCSMTCYNASAVAGYVYVAPVESTGSYADPFGSFTIAPDCYVWGAQLETGYLTSYIPTNTAALTRDADVVATNVATRGSDFANITGTDFTTFYNKLYGTLYAEYSRPVSCPNSFVVEISDNTFNEFMAIYTDGAPNHIAGLRDGGVTQMNVNYTTGVGTNNLVYKEVIAYSLNSSAQVAGGILYTDDTGCTIPTVDRMNIGAFNGSSQFLNGHIRRIMYYPKRLSNASLQAITK